MYSEEKLIEMMYPVKDPEIDASIIDIGLIYGAEHKENGDVYVDLTLTSPQCPLGPEIIDDIERVLGEDDEINSVYVNLTFDPPWSPERFTEELNLDFGYPI
jgi:metal-sulfur cluster biosynthetic enzyme